MIARIASGFSTLLVSLSFCTACAVDLGGTRPADPSFAATDDTRNGSPSTAAPNEPESTGADEGDDSDAGPSDEPSDPVSTPPQAVDALACPDTMPTSIAAGSAKYAGYAQVLDVGGVPVLGSAAVAKDAFRRVHHVLASVLALHPCATHALGALGLRVVIVGSDEAMSDVPDLHDAEIPAQRRFRADVVRPVVTVGEELLTSSPAPSLLSASLVHDLSRALFELGVRDVTGGQGYFDRVDAAYQAALAQGTWADSIGAESVADYWAQGFVLYVRDEPGVGTKTSRDTLAATDPALFDLMKEAVGDAKFVPDCSIAPATRAWVDPLAGMDPAAQACSFEVSDLLPTVCDKARGLRSERGDTAITIEFVNRTSESFDLQWIGYTGLRSHLRTLAPRSEQTVDTYATHPFVALRSDGTCVSVIEGASSRSRVIIE